MAKLGTYNISVTLVKSTLGAGTNDIGTLCKHENINMWSKWKPIRCNGITLTEDALKSNNYGIKITQDFLNLPSVIPLRKWEYMRPAGGASSPYRLGDFRNYAHNSRPVFQQYKYGFSTDFTVSTNTTIKNIYLETYDDNVDGDLTVNDLRIANTTLGNCYVGMCLFDDTGHCALIATSQDKIGLKTRTLLAVDMRRVDGDYWGGYFLSTWKLDEQLNFPTGGQVPTADVYFLDGNPTSISVQNTIIGWSFPYTFWNSEDFKYVDGVIFSPDSQTYTYRSTNTGTALVPAGTASGVSRGYVIFDGRGYIELAPKIIMEEFPTWVKTIVLTGINNAFMNYTPNLSDGSKLYMTLITYFDIDYIETAIGIEYKYVENSYYGIWYARVFHGNEEDTDFSPQFEVARKELKTGNYTYNTMNKLEMNVDYSGESLMMVIKAVCKDGSHNLSLSYTYIQNDSEIKIGGGGAIIHTDEGNQDPNYMAAGALYVNYYADHA